MIIVTMAFTSEILMYMFLYIFLPSFPWATYSYLITYNDFSEYTYVDIFSLCCGTFLLTIFHLKQSISIALNEFNRYFHDFLSLELKWIKKSTL